VRWSLERMALFVVPVSAAMIALALPAMRAVSFGEASGQGPGLLAAALAALAVGLYPYGAFLLLARGYYALGDSRTPGIVALVSAAAGVAVMGIGAVLTDGAARVAVLGAGHSAAYGLGALVLLVGLGRRAGGSVSPRGWWAIAGLSSAVGAVGWLAGEALLADRSGRAVDLAVVAGIGAVGAALVALGYRAIDLPARLTSRVPGPTGGRGADPAAPEVLA
jgi:putative peptidoglycan lipid II flippase